jgi:hypothetical protein
MCEVTLDFLREALNAPVERFRTEVLKEGYLPSTVYRVQLEGAGTPPSVILKCFRPPWGTDTYRGAREYCTYHELLTRIPIPQAGRYFGNLGDEVRHTRIVMEDLQDTHVFYPEAHAWTWSEGQAILRTLAELHSAAESLEPARRPYLMSRLCARWTPERMREMVADLMNTSWLAARVRPVASRMNMLLNELPRLEAAAANEPLTLVHYDVYPPNVALSRDTAHPEAVLIDWAAATADIGEIDLAFVFQQPYKSDRLLDWSAGLRYYWEERKRLTGKPYVWQERLAVFRYARIQALFTTMLAIHRAWGQCLERGLQIAPDSPDPYMRFFDAALNDILDTLAELTEDTPGNG